MQGLLLKLSALDADVENAVRIISFFDSLIEQQPSLDVLVRNAAAVAECAVGIQESEGRFALRATPDGRTDAGRAAEGATIARVSSSHQAWLGRGGADALPLDQMLLERFGLSAIAALGRGRTPTLALGDPALIELVVAQSTEAPERSRALQLLGLTPATSVTFLAASGPTKQLDVLVSCLGELGGKPRCAVIGPVRAVVLLGPPPSDLHPPDGVTLGVGPATRAIDAPAAWQKAVRALRYATPVTNAGDVAARPMVHATRLGAFDLLAARLRSDDIRDVADIDVLDELAAEPQGAEMIRTLEVVVEAGSLREAARTLYLHHNSVSGRLARAEERLGYRIADPSGIARLGLAIALRRLRNTDLLG